MIRRQPLFLVAAVGVAALAVYVATLAPGLIAIEDTPKFQFVGRILGTAHPPGYPVYVVLSHLFGLLPIGNLAWRINLLSALFATLTVVFCQLTAVELGVAPLIAAATGLGLATGSSFWFAATIAEVYSLHGCFVAAMIFAMLRWRRTGRAAWFFVAIATFSIGLGHHTSIVTVGPAVAIFAIAVAPRFALGPKTLAAILAMFVLGFSQYLFILVRTKQHAWGESPASNLIELFDVVRGARWAGYIAPITLDTVIARVPGIVRLLTNEVSMPVMVVALAGVAVLARRDRAAMCLFLGAIAGVAGFATFFSGQTEGFLQPAFLVLWLLAAVGLDAMARATSSAGRGATAAAAVLLAGVAVWHGSRNLETRDLSHRRFEMRYFDALSLQLPPHSGLMAEDFLVDRMVLYQKFSGPAFGDHDIVTQVEATPTRAMEYAARGYRLFAFGKSAAQLREAGFAFDYAMWPMEYGSIRQYLLDQPRGTVIAFAVPALRLGTTLAQGALPIDLIGGRIPQPSWSNLTAIGVVGRAGGLQSLAEKHPTSVFAGRGAAIGATGVASPTDILAEAADDRASIRIGAREIVRSREPVVALWGPRGEFVAAFALTAGGNVPMPDSPLSLHRLSGVHEWTPIGSSPADMSSAGATGHVTIRQSAPLSQTIIYAGRRQRSLAPSLFDAPASPGQLVVQEFVAGSDELRRALARDGWAPQPSLQSLAHIYRIELPPSAGTFHLGFGGIPDVVVSRWTGAGEPAAWLTFDLSGQLERIDARTDRLHVARDHHRLFLAGGWSPVSADETGGFAMTTGAEAEILLPCQPGACTTLDLQMWSARDGEAVSLLVNSTPLAPQPLRASWQSYRWVVPAAALHSGMNSVVVQAGQSIRLADVLIAKADVP